jgi:hypothetical protein
VSIFTAKNEKMESLEAKIRFKIKTPLNYAIIPLICATIPLNFAIITLISAIFH